MLVLTRKEGDCIKIGKDIWITIVEVERGKVRVGIEAPREIPVFRTELIGEVSPHALAARVKTFNDTPPLPEVGSW